MVQADGPSPNLAQHEAEKQDRKVSRLRVYRQGLALPQLQFLDGDKHFSQPQTQHDSQN